MFFERIEGNFVFGRVNNPPFIRQSDTVSGNVENPAGGSAAPLFPSAVTGYDIYGKAPAVQNWSLVVQHMLLADTLLDAACVASNSRHLLRAGTIQRNAGVNTNALWPCLEYAGLTYDITGANFNDYSLQIQARRKMNGGSLLNVACTGSKAITGASGWNEGPMDSYNFKNERSLASYDRRHIFVFSSIYPLPFRRAQDAWFKKTFGGRQLSGPTTMQSGRPLSLGITGDRAGDGGSAQRPDVVGDWRKNGGTRLRWFAPEAFAAPALGTFSNLGRNVLIGPGTNNWDLSLQKQFVIARGVRTEFRAEFYNAPHHFSYYGVDTAVGRATFGQVHAAGDPRILQFGLRLSY